MQRFVETCRPAALKVKGWLWALFLVQDTGCAVRRQKINIEKSYILVHFDKLTVVLWFSVVSQYVCSKSAALLCINPPGFKVEYHCQFLIPGASAAKIFSFILAEVSVSAFWLS